MLANKPYWRLDYFSSPIDLAWLGALNMEVLNPFRRAVATALKSLPFATRIWRHEVERQHVTPSKGDYQEQGTLLWPANIKYL